VKTTTAHRRALPGRLFGGPERLPGARWPLALAGALVVARAAVLLLRPSEGLIEPDPVDVQEYFSPEDIARARRFGRPQLALHALGGVVQAGVLVAFVVHPLRIGAPARVGRRIGRQMGSQVGRRVGRQVGRQVSRGPGQQLGAARRASGMSRPARGRSARPLLESSLVGASLSVLVGLAPLPLSALARRRAVAVGLVTQSWRGWLVDVGKSSAIEAGLAAVAAPTGVALMRRLPRSWWLPGAGLLVAGAGGMTLLAPVVLEPLFNRYTPLPAGELREDVLELARRAGVEVGEVYSVNASLRTTAANAYVTGLGPTKRVVLFDTLLERFTRDETRLVVAHELAHVRHRDVPRGLLYLGLVAPAGLLAAAQLTRRLVGSAQADAATLPALALSLGVVSAAVGSISSALSRRVECRADAFSLRLTDTPEPFIGFERRIVRQNVADPDPPRLLVRLLASHPPTVERIGIARAYARRAQAGSGQRASAET
jgi:STE24 endopeptidase